MSTIPPPINFVGLSQFSESFQTVLERSFTVANLPVNNLRTEQTNLLNQQTALTNLASDVQGLRDAFSSLGILGAQGAVTTSSSDTEVAAVAVTGTPPTSSFTLNVTSAASVAQESSVLGLPDVDSTPLSPDGFFRLTLGSTTTDIDLLTIGAGRTAGTIGSATPAPPVSVQVDFSNGLTGSITAELNSFFVAAAAPSNAAAGDTIEVSFTSDDGSIVETITTAALSGGEDAAAIAAALNAEIAANAALAGKASFSDAGGALKLVVSDSAGTGFSFTSVSNGSVVSGLESGGVVGGQSAQEIAAALNAQVASDPTLAAAGVEFIAQDGEVRVRGDKAFDIAVADDDQGTGFASGLAGNHSIAGFDNTLSGLRDFINAGGLGVQAAVINTSSDPDNPDFHLSLTAQETGATTLTLVDGADAQLLTAVNQGTDAVFTVNGVAAANSSNTIPDFAPGLSLTIVGPGAATIAASNDTAGARNALSGLVSSYNAVVAAIGSQIGEEAGVLSGNVIVREAQSALRAITSFLGEGDVFAMSSLGLVLDRDGILSFETATFDQLAGSNFAAVREFIGDTTTGFAGNALARLGDLADPVSGRIQTAIRFIQESDARLNRQIDAALERVDQFIANLEAQFQAADTLLAQLESQQTLLTRILAPPERNDR